MSPYSIIIKPFGSHAILIAWPNEVKEEILNDVLAFEEHLKTKCLDDNEYELVPSYNSITLIQRENPLNFQQMKQQLEKWYASKNSDLKRQKHLWRLPVCYDLEFGLDLPFVSEKLNLSVAEIIKKHTTHVFTVYGIGFLPGFMYLGGLPSQLHIPRKSTPKLNVQKGAVGLAGKQTGIYPQDSPGGWNIIGKTSVELFNPKLEKPCFVNIGDKVQFYAIERAEYDLHKIEAEVGIYKYEKQVWHT